MLMSNPNTKSLHHGTPVYVWKGRKVYWTQKGLEWRTCISCENIFFCCG